MSEGGKDSKSSEGPYHFKHRERPEDSDDEDDPNKKRSKEDDVREGELDEWRKKTKEAGASEPSSPPEEVDDSSSLHDIESNGRMVIDSSSGMEGTLKQAVERIKFLESEAISQEELIKGMEAQIQTKTDLVNIAN